MNGATSVASPRDRAPSARRAATGWALAAVVLGIVVFHMATVREGHPWGDDFAQYLHHAKNIVEGIPYAETGYLYDPTYPQLGPRVYPPGFPVILAPVYALFGLDLMAMKRLVVFFLGAALLVLALFYDRELPRRYAFAGVLLIGLNPFFWEFKDMVNSDYPFLFLVYLCLLAFERQEASGVGRGKPAWLPCAALGALVYWAVATRSIGIVLVPTFLLFDLLRFRRPGRASVVVAGLCVALIGVQSLLLPGGGSYLEQLSTSPRVILANVPFYTGSISVFWKNGYSEVPRVILLVATLALGGLGYVNRVWTRLTVFEIFAPLYLAAVLVWPTTQGIRFLIPVIPLYLLYVFVGILGIQSRFGWEERSPLFWAIVLAGLVSYGTRYTTLDFGRLKTGIGSPGAVDLFRYVREQTSPHSVFVFQKPRVLALLTGRSASAYHLGEDAELVTYFRRLGVTHVVDGPPSLTDGPGGPGFLSRLLARNPERFEPVYASSEFTVYRFFGR